MSPWAYRSTPLGQTLIRWLSVIEDKGVGNLRIALVKMPIYQVGRGVLAESPPLALRHLW